MELKCHKTLGILNNTFIPSLFYIFLIIEEHTLLSTML